MAGRMTIRELLVKIGVQTDQAKLQAFDDAVTRVKQTAIVATAAVAGLVVGAYRLAAATATAADDAATNAAKIGITTEAYQELEYVSARADLSIEEMSSTLKLQARNLETAKEGTGEAADALKKLGIAANDVRLQDQVSALGLLVERMRTLKTSQERVALAQRLWGRSGTALVPLIEDQTLSIEALRKEAHKLGYIMDADAIAAGQRFDDALKEAQFTAQGLKNTLGIALVPAFTTLLTRFREWVAVNRDLVKGNLEKWATRLGDAILWVANHADALTLALEVLAGGWAATKIVGFAQTLLALFNGLKAGFVALAGVLGVGVGPLLAIVAGISAVVAGYVALGLVIQDLIVYFRGGKSAIGEWIARHAEAEGVVGSLARMAQALLDLFRALGSYVSTTLQPVFDALSMTVDAVGEAIGKAMDKASAFLSSRAVSYLERQTGYVQGLTGAVQGATAPTLAGMGRGGSSTSNTVTGGTYNISGVGLDAAGAESLVRGLRGEELRQAASVLTVGSR